MSEREKRLEAAGREVLRWEKDAPPHGGLASALAFLRLELAAPRPPSAPTDTSLAPWTDGTGTGSEWAAPFAEPKVTVKDVLEQSAEMLKSAASDFEIARALCERFADDLESSETTFAAGQSLRERWREAFGIVPAKAPSSPDPGARPCPACFLDAHGGEINAARGGTLHVCGRPGAAVQADAPSSSAVSAPPAAGQPTRGEGEP